MRGNINKNEEENKKKRKQGERKYSERNERNYKDTKIGKNANMQKEKGKISKDEKLMELIRTYKNLCQCQT